MSKEANKLGAAVRHDEPAGSARHDEDPLVELARIVSGGPLYPRREPGASDGEDDAAASGEIAGDAAEPVIPVDVQPPEVEPQDDVFAGDVTAGLERELFAEFDAPEVVASIAPEVAAPVAPDVAETETAGEPASSNTQTEAAEPEAAPDMAPQADNPRDMLAEIGRMIGAAPAEAPAEHADVVPDVPTAEASSAEAAPADTGASSESLLASLRQNFAPQNEQPAADEVEPVAAEDTPAEEPSIALEPYYGDETGDLEEPVADDSAIEVSSGEVAETEGDGDYAAADDIEPPQPIDLAEPEATFEADFSIEAESPAEIVEPSLDAPADGFEVGQSVDGEPEDVSFEVGIGETEELSAEASFEATSELDGEGVDTDVPDVEMDYLPEIEASPDGLEAVEAALLSDIDLGGDETDVAEDYQEVAAQEPEIAVHDQPATEINDFASVEDGYDDYADDAPSADHTYQDDAEVLEPPRVAVDLDEAYGTASNPYESTDEEVHDPAYDDGYDAEPAEAYEDEPEDGYEDYPADEQEYVNGDGYGVAAEEAEPYYSDDEAMPPHSAEELAASPAESQSSRGLWVAAAVAGIVVVGLGGFFGYRFIAGDAPSGPPPVITADTSPVKIAPETPQKTAETQRSKLIYDRVGGDADNSRERLVIRSEDPVNRVSDSGADGAGTANGTSAPSSASQPTLPRRVRTVVVRPDGTIVDPKPATGDAATNEAVETVAIRPTTNDIKTPADASGTGETGSNPSVADTQPNPSTSGSDAVAAFNPKIPQPKPVLTRTAALPDTSSAAETAPAPASDGNETAETADASGTPATPTASDSQSTTEAQTTSDAQPAADAADGVPTPPALQETKPEPAPRKVATNPRAQSARKVKTQPVRIAPVPNARPAATSPAPTTTAPARKVASTPPANSSVRPTTPTGSPAATRSGPLDLTSGGAPAQPAPAQRAQTPNQPAAAQPAAASGNYTVQVSSQRSEAQAQAAYKSLQQKHPSLFGPQSARILRADLGDKGVYYRVRVGPMARAQANQFCSNLKKRGGDCFVRRN